VELIVNLLAQVEVIVFAWAIVQMEFRKNKIRIVTGTVVVVLLAFFRTFCSDIDIRMIIGVIIGPVVAWTILFNEKGWKILFKYFFSISYVNLMYLPVGLFITCIGEKMGLRSDSNISYAVQSILSILIMLCLAYFVKKKRDIVEWIRVLPIGYFLLAWVCAVTVDGLSTYAKSVIAADTGIRVRIIFESMRTILSIFIYLLGIGFAFADFLRKKYKSESILKEQYLNMSKEHYNGLVAHMQEVRKIKHDMQAHINILNKYAEEEKWAMLKEYLGILTQQHSQQKLEVVNTGNELVDAVVANSLSKCADDRIIIECKGKLSEEVKVSDFDLCTIFSNLLSNAVEACRKLTVSEKKIHITFQNVEDEVRIVFENPVEWEIDTKALGTYTSKSDKDNHGFGIGNVRRTVEKYDGRMIMGIEDGVFKTVIIFVE